MGPLTLIEEYAQCTVLTSSPTFTVDEIEVFEIAD
jgi:hypothetical protein